MEKKYRITDKHPSFKEDGILTKSIKKDYGYRLEIDETINYIFCPDILLNHWLRVDWIEGVVIPEFTKDEMIKFGNWCYSIYPNRSVNNKINHIDVSQWLSERETNNLKTK